MANTHCSAPWWASRRAPTATAEQREAIIAKGGMGCGVFVASDSRTFEELSGRGAQFIIEPTERPYGVEAMFRDNSGNWFSLYQAPKQPSA